MSSFFWRFVLRVELETLFWKFIGFGIMRVLSFPRLCKACDSVLLNWFLFILELLLNCGKFVYEINSRISWIDGVFGPDLHE